jgi:hypothetical protein
MKPVDYLADMPRPIQTERGGKFSTPFRDDKIFDIVKTDMIKFIITIRKEINK